MTSIRAVLGLLVPLTLAPAASAVEVVLLPEYRPGETYALSLEHTTRTHALSRGSEGESTEDRVRLRYAATVEVVEVDGRGHVTRESHDDVRLSVERPDAAGSLFEPGTTLDVRRDPDGGTRIYREGYRVDDRVETIVEEILGTRFEYTVQPKLFDPGRPVAVGESWTLDAALARSFLRSRGIRVLDLDGEPTATLRGEADEDGEPVRVIEYRIPIAWFELTDMPANAQVSRSDASFEGRIRLAAESGRPPTAFTSRLDLRLAGLRRTREGLTQPLAWSVQSSKRSIQSVVMADPASTLAASRRAD